MTAYSSAGSSPGFRGRATSHGVQLGQFQTKDLLVEEQQGTKRLVLGAGGTKAFRVMTYVRGKAQSTKIGTYPNMSVKAARDKARELHKDPDRFKERAAAAKNTAAMIRIARAIPVGA